MKWRCVECALLAIVAALPGSRAAGQGWSREASGSPPVTLGRPTGASSPAVLDHQVQRASHSVLARLEEPIANMLVQAPDALPGVPTSPDERFNCGVVTEAPGSGHFLSTAPRRWWEKCRDFGGGLLSSEGATPRTRFQSDHGFDNMISPVTNPFLFEDPRALTELRPIVIVQGTPSGSPFGGGNIEYLGLQARVAFTERLSLVITEFGYIWINPASDSPFDDSNGGAEFRIGPKYTFYRCEPSGTVAAAGLTLDIPVGSSRVFQNTGDLSLQPYLCVGQTFGRSTWGSFNFMGVVGYSVATDDERTDFIYTSLHLDYDVANLRKFYPFLEFSYFNYTDAGNAVPFNFEGRDLINFGSSGVEGNDAIAMAIGLRYKISETLQFGAAYEFPLNDNRSLIDYRLTFDFILRY